ncbi:hypothetical protein MGYG_06563 [Nannizzia gypsea CBS 118893]|uniref:Amidoligase enzyme n=1 Tax=Arthroderma gypseum (strain ATCC MYA-4604 / CBS 118893) TaxID=535722 RepID=E4UZN6_ARTGP|nr:hypothetical protein MGYG_06563 [Nannizzia gypsea CBS 118893]EFR03566.1 hypothetical protein MGYG_06563 [Nannizzia gypsea CBS 118893]
MAGISDRALYHKLTKPSTMAENPYKLDADDLKIGTPEYFWKCYFFIHGSLMDIEVLAEALGVPSNDLKLKLRPAQVLSYETKFWRGCPVLQHSQFDATVDGMAYYVKTREERERLIEHQPKEYIPHNCHIRFSDLPNGETEQRAMNVSASLSRIVEKEMSSSIISEWPSVALGGDEDHPTAHSSIPFFKGLLDISSYRNISLLAYIYFSPISIHCQVEQMDADYKVGIEVEIVLIPEDKMLKSIEDLAKKFLLSNAHPRSCITNWKKSVTSVFNHLRSFADLAVNSSCGFHVHVSKEKGSWNLEDLKRISRAINYFESSIELVVPESRRRNIWGKSNWTDNPRFDGLSEEDSYALIEACTNDV